MKKAALLIPFIILLISFGCRKRSAVFSDSELKISVSTVCGWCAGGDSLIIGARKSVYKSFAGCEGNPKETVIATDRSAWEALTSSLNLEAFRNIQLNVCNVCADGCDIRATVRNSDYNHSISYGSINNEAVAAIRPFLTKLEAIRLRYANAYKK